MYQGLDLALSKRVDSLFVYCKSCNLEEYSFSPSHLLINDLQFIDLVKADCLKCPYGASCNTVEVKSKINFWGEIYNIDGVEKVEMTLCPEEYCCQSPVCDTFCFVVVVGSFQLMNAFSETGYPAFYR